MTEQLQTQMQIQPEAVMNGFCWNYSNSLLTKLIDLRQEHRLFDGDNVTYIALSVIGALKDQINGPYRGVHTNFEDINNLINVASEFLTIFYKK